MLGLPMNPSNLTPLDKKRRETKYELRGWMTVVRVITYGLHWIVAM